MRLLQAFTELLFADDTFVDEYVDQHGADTHLAGEQLRGSVCIYTPSSCLIFEATGGEVFGSVQLAEF